MAVVVGIDLRCVPVDESAGAGIAHAARELTRALVAYSQVTWKTYPQGISLRRALKKSPCDVLFVPSGAVSLGLPVPVIPWVHDLAIYEHPEWFPQSVIRRAFTTFAFRRGVQRAPRVLAVSEHTKSEIVRLFHVDPSLIDVTLEGGDSALASLQGETLREAKQRAKKKLAERGITRPFVLALGTVEPRKNLAMLARACPCDLVIAGRDGWKFQDVETEIKGKNNIHRISEFSDEEKRDLLLAAEIVVIPSLHEGFSLVALEAMQAGTAVIASRVGAFPEVVQDAGILLPPTDETAWRAAIRDLMSDDEDRQRLAEKGKLRSAAMTWEKSAEIVLQSLTKTKE